MCFWHNMQYRAWPAVLQCVSAARCFIIWQDIMVCDMRLCAGAPYWPRCPTASGHPDQCFTASDSKRKEKLGHPKILIDCEISLMTICTSINSGQKQQIASVQVVGNSRFSLHLCCTHLVKFDQSDTLPLRMWNPSRTLFGVLWLLRHWIYSPTSLKSTTWNYHLVCSEWTSAAILLMDSADR